MIEFERFSEKSAWARRVNAAMETAESGLRSFPPRRAPQISGDGGSASGCGAIGGAGVDRVKWLTNYESSEWGDEPIEAGSDWTAAEVLQVRGQGAAAERKRIMAALEALAPPEFQRGIYDSMVARAEHRAKREHHAKIVAAITEAEGGDKS